MTCVSIFRVHSLAPQATVCAAKQPSIKLIKRHRKKTHTKYNVTEFKVCISSTSSSIFRFNSLWAGRDQYVNNENT